MWTIFFNFWKWKFKSKVQKIVIASSVTLAVQKKKKNLLGQTSKVLVQIKYVQIKFDFLVLLWFTSFALTSIFHHLSLALFWKKGEKLCILHSVEAQPS